MPEKAPVFGETYRQYLAQVREQDISRKQDALGVHVEGDDVVVPFFNIRYQVNARGVFDGKGISPAFAVSVVICRYLIHYQAAFQSRNESSEWTSYRDFRDAAPLIHYFTENTEKAIARNFEGRVIPLKTACERLGGQIADDGLPYDLAMQLSALPRVPLLLLFNDADDEFPAYCSLLFERKAGIFLDMECLAIVGALFSDFLLRA